MTKKQIDNLTLVVPAKEDTDCLFHVLEELKNFDIEKIIVIPKNDELPKEWKFEKMQIKNQNNKLHNVMHFVQKNLML